MVWGKGFGFRGAASSMDVPLRIAQRRFQLAQAAWKKVHKDHACLEVCLTGGKLIGNISRGKLPYSLLTTSRFQRFLGMEETHRTGCAGFRMSE